jgi:hypothetical protein
MLPASGDRRGSKRSESVGLELIGAGVLVLLAVSALAVLRRDRLEPRTVNPIAVGMARGLAVVILGWLVLSFVVGLALRSS